MCGRFSFAVKARIIEESFDINVGEPEPAPLYNCAPSQSLAVISSDHPDVLSYYRWGLIPVWAKDMSIGNKMINAKAETISEKPSFKNPYNKKRCLILADSFYEWQKETTRFPFRILKRDERPFAMAGIWDAWYNKEGEEIRSFSIITTIANELLAPIHHRMPVILDKEAGHLWLSSLNGEEVAHLLQPYSADDMKAYRISKKVNSPLNNFAELHQIVSGKEDSLLF